MHKIADRIESALKGVHALKDVHRLLYVTRFYKTDPNRISGKIKLTPPVDSYTIVLLKLLEAGFSRHLFWVVCSARMAVSRLVKDLA